MNLGEPLRGSVRDNLWGPVLDRLVRQTKSGPHHAAYYGLWNVTSTQLALIFQSGLAQLQSHVDSQWEAAKETP